MRFGAAASHGGDHADVEMSWAGLFRHHCSGNPTAHGVRTVGQSVITVWKMTDNVVETLGDIN